MYTDFAGIYDRLMHDLDYKRWTDYLELLFKRNGASPSLILELGCGTGNFCIELAKRGYEMIGIDSSVDMLSRAKSKSADEGLDVLYLNQDMTAFELYGTVDAAICLVDSINYVLRKDKLAGLFNLVRNYLNPGGIFIFDVNTEYKFENTLRDGVFYEVREDVAYIWQSRYQKKNRICRYDLTFFVNSGTAYDRYDETHYERAYSTQELKTAIKKAGLDLCGVYGGLTMNPPCPKSERIFFCARKQEKIPLFAAE